MLRHVADDDYQTVKLRRDELLERAKARAREEDRSLASLVRRALVRYLDEGGDRA